jgi:hypothetical protein
MAAIAAADASTAACSEAACSAPGDCPVFPLAPELFRTAGDPAQPDPNNSIAVASIETLILSI